MHGPRRPRTRPNLVETAIPGLTIATTRHNHGPNSIARDPGMSAGYWLGVDLGGTKILSGLFDDELKLLARSKQPTSAEGGPSAVFARIVQGVEAVVKE